MQKLYTMIERVAATSANVMLMGESGAGKKWWRRRYTMRLSVMVR